MMLKTLNKKMKIIVKNLNIQMMILKLNKFMNL